MGRSRGKFHAGEDPTQRSRKKKNPSPTGENWDSVPADQGSSDGKVALYHCNYCNKDISGRTRIKCVVCTDFDLCIECFSVGAELYPHKSGHPYHVLDNLSFPIISPEWNADEEMLLLEGLEMYGMGNWAEVAEHVGTKSKDVCIEHYTNAYLNSPKFPLPDMTQVLGKNKDEVLEMAKCHVEDKTGVLQINEETPFSLSRDNNYSGKDPNKIKFTRAKVNKKTSNVVFANYYADPLKTEDHVSGRSFGGSKLKSAKIDSPCSMGASGYNPKREEFDPEYDNDAEHLLADMEFKDTDSEVEHQLKLRVLHIYSKRLDERKRRKDFILERNLLQYPYQYQGLSQEESELCRRYDVFMRFHSKEEHEELLKTVISEHRILKRMTELKEARAAGCRTSAEADRYLEQRRRFFNESVHRKQTFQQGPSSQGNPSIPLSSGLLGTYSTITPAACQVNSSTGSNFASVSGASLLSESEKQLCREMKLAPEQYLKIQEDMSRHVLTGKITKKSDSYSLFPIEPIKISRIYDMLMRKGIAPS